MRTYLVFGCAEHLSKNDDWRAKTCRRRKRRGKRREYNHNTAAAAAAVDTSKLKFGVCCFVSLFLSLFLCMCAFCLPHAPIHTINKFVDTPPTSVNDRFIVVVAVCFVWQRPWKQLTHTVSQSCLCVRVHVFVWKICWQKEVKRKSIQIGIEISHRLQSTKIKFIANFNNTLPSARQIHTKLDFFALFPFCASIYVIETKNKNKS